MRQPHHLSDAKTQKPGEDQRHHHLRYAAAQISPARRRRVRGAHYVGREHHGGVILRDHERRADRADRQAEQQKRLIVMRKPDEHHRESNRGSAARYKRGAGRCGRTETDQRADDHGDRNGRDREIADLRFGEVEFRADHGHQRRKPEPSEETDEECEPRHVERPHRNAGEVSEPDAGGFVFQCQQRSPCAQNCIGESAPTGETD